MRKEIENRLIDFAVSVIKLCRKLKNDFIHKTSIVLKELRETDIFLKIIRKAKLVNEGTFDECLLNECNELIAIFHKTVKTAKSRKKTK